ncbi:MAG: DUF664 domain-containing protein [Acidimicrobiales bacterium]
MSNGVEDEIADLQDCLQYQRSSVLSNVGGSSEEAWPVSAVPSGWTSASFVEHLGATEYDWFQQVVAGLSGDELPEDQKPIPFDRFAAFTCD